MDFYRKTSKINELDTHTFFYCWKFNVVYTFRKEAKNSFIINVDSKQHDSISVNIKWRGKCGKKFSTHQERERESEKFTVHCLKCSSHMPKWHFPRANFYFLPSFALWKLNFETEMNQLFNKMQISAFNKLVNV